MIVLFLIKVSNMLIQLTRQSYDFFFKYTNIYDILCDFIYTYLIFLSRIPIIHLFILYQLVIPMSYRQTSWTCRSGSGVVS